jgi:hypothetical protein
VFRLVALDGTDVVRAAFVLAGEWARQFGSQMWFIQLMEESSRRRCADHGSRRFSRVSRAVVDRVKCAVLVA